MEEQKKQEHSKWCCDWHGHGHSIIRIILGIVILVVVFALGVKMGEFKSSLGRGDNYYYGGYGGHNMMSPYRMMSPYYYGQQYPWMM